MSQFIVPFEHNDPRLFSPVSQAFSLADLGKRLLDAAKNGDVEEVKNLISCGAPFTTDWLGISALHFAAMNGHLSSCEALLRAGISRDARTKVDRTPLHLAAQEGHADIVELLLRSGADLGAKDMLRMTALHWAAERGHTHVVQMLMRFGANAHLQNKFEMTPLDIAESKHYNDARDAMLNTQYELILPVRRMVNTNENLVDASAYILTEEKTLVPAAPPADEVTVTATAEEESGSTENPQTSEIFLNHNVYSNNSNDNNQSTGATTHSGAKNKTRFVNRPIWETGEIDENTNQAPEAQALPCSSSHSRPDSTSKPNMTEDALLSFDENCARDFIIVETPDGETLYVRQQSNEDGTSGLVILTSTGEEVNNPALMEQVMDAMISLPGQGISDTVNSNNVNFDSDLTTSPLQRPKNNSKSVDNQTTVVSSDSSSLQPDTNGCQTNCQQLSPHITENDDDDEDGEEDNEDSDNEESDPLVAHLASVANQPRSEQPTICVEGMGPGASPNHLRRWCVQNGIYIRGNAEEPSFIVEFIHEDEAYTLSASYDSESGCITFSHVKTEEEEGVEQF
ncbi:unnamed protein product [Trichobilharzia szidati]|nr:unnamed protein product [Trichobilharzia szidati]